MRRHGISLAGLLVVSVVLAVVIRFGPALSFSLALASPSTETWLASFQEQARREDIVLPAAFGGLRTDLYRPARSRGVLLLVHGLSRAGRRQPDLVRLARLLGAHGLIVVVPQFEGLTAFRLSGREVDDVRAALAYTTTLGKPPAIAGFSFGAGPALLAAASFPDLRVAASFGGYADLTHVIAYVTTGAHSFAEHRYVRKQEEYNRWKLLALLVAFVLFASAIFTVASPNRGATHYGTHCAGGRRPTPMPIPSRAEGGSVATITAPVTTGVGGVLGRPVLVDASHVVMCVAMGLMLLLMI